MQQLEIDGISCDNVVTTTTILPKGGPPCSLWAGYSDFHQLSRQSLSYTSIPLVPKLPKPSDKERDTEKNNTEKVPITPPVIVVTTLSQLMPSISSCRVDWFWESQTNTKSQLAANVTLPGSVFYAVSCSPSILSVIYVKHYLHIKTLCPFSLRRLWRSRNIRGWSVSRTTQKHMFEQPTYHQLKKNNKQFNNHILQDLLVI